jgi:tRNA nucleotidyltransferase (CCA-adding enzyme)
LDCGLQLGYHGEKMRIVLTHEQADFDALASMLGAYLVDSTAQPVLPRRMNRNVRAFVTLYGVELPFIDARDLPNHPVEAVCLVDTQTMATVRGIGPDTKVHIVDHHSKRDDNPPGWTLVTEEVGATTTLFVEQLIELGVELTILHATLLLLGIYEDTGSLTYTRTTPRDLQAASFLLEQGASLSLAADFINHPLSQEQQAIYDELRNQVKSYPIHGHSIMIACGDAKDLEEELSTVAHKLRDLMDPEALFLLVRTHSGVQMIGRSTSDHIDVAEISSLFGGGGHPRAAASLIKGREVEEVCQELVRLLPNHVRPAITVAEIMSHSPQVLGPEVMAQDAAERMQRYGYEGYPVVRDSRVIGLLTRRAVDRAISHKLNLPASSLMNAGEVIAYPNDSIEHLQRLMTDSGWGQVPVIDPGSGSIIGIVTRTDLLKTLTSQISRPGVLNLTDRLDQTLPPIRLSLLRAIANIATNQRVALYIVGGFVRDLLLERHSLDFDLVVEGDAIGLAEQLCQKFGGRLTTHSRFGTAKWIIGEFRESLGVILGHTDSSDELPEYLDLITARTEFYTHPTALPTVEQGSIKLDLHRRDFTINTLALRLDGNHYGKLYDYWGGMNDLRERKVRVLHSLSFVDDPTRILRAVRFEQRFKFTLETRTEELLTQALTMLSRISGERIRHELDHIVDEVECVAMLARLNQLGLLSTIHPALRWNKQIEQRFLALEKSPPPFFESLPAEMGEELSKRKLAYMLWMIGLSKSQTQDLLHRLKYPKAQAEQIEAACKLWDDLPDFLDMPPSFVVRRLDDVAAPPIYANCLASQDGRVCTILLTYLSRWRKVNPTIRGYDLQERGLAPGPAYKRILGALKDAWLDEKVRSVEEEKELFEKLLRDENCFVQ